MTKLPNPIPGTRWTVHNLAPAILDETTALKYAGKFVQSPGMTVEFHGFDLAGAPMTVEVFVRRRGSHTLYVRRIA